MKKPKFMANLIEFTSRIHVNDSTFCAYLQEKRFVSGKALIMRLATVWSSGNNFREFVWNL